MKKIIFLSITLFACLTNAFTQNIALYNNNLSLTKPITQGRFNLKTNASEKIAFGYKNKTNKLFLNSFGTKTESFKNNSPFTSPKPEDFKVVDQTNSIRLLHIRPNMVIGISPVDKEFMVQLNVDCQYWYKETFDVRASLLSGTLTGARIGGTFHLIDQTFEKTHKFIVSESESKGVRTTEFYKKTAKVRKVKGLTGDLLVSIVNASKDASERGLYTEVRGGLDFQYFSRNYLDANQETYPSNKNGWFSLKFLGLVNYSKIQNSNAIGGGALASLSAVRRPWKGVSMYLCMDMGVTFGKGGITPIISPGFGVSINLIGSKKPIDY